MRTLSILTALLFLAGCSAFQFQLTASPEPGVAEPTPIPAPAAGKRVEVDVKPGQTVCLDVPDLKGARMVVRDDGLLIVMPDGGEIFLANFRPDPVSGLPAALCLADQTVALVLEGRLGGIAPAAGPGVPDDPLARAGEGGGTVASDGGKNNRSGQADNTNPGGVDNDDQGGTDNPGGGGSKK